MRRRDFIGTSLAALAAGQAEAGPTGNIGYGTPYGPSGGLPGPTLDLNFLAGTLDSRITFTRASSATYFDVNGAMQTAGTNVARFDFDPVTHAARGLLIEESRVNSIRNSTMVGAVPGTPGTPPTNWVVNAMGLSQQIVGTGIVNGIPYVDIRVFGTNTTQFGAIKIETTSGIAASNGQVWTNSVWWAVVGGSLTNIPFLGTAQSCTPSGAPSPNYFTPTSTFTRYAFTNTVGAGATNTWPSVFFNAPGAAGYAIDVTFRIGAPQLELGAFATSFIPTSTVAATRAADVATMPVGAWFNAAAGTLAAESQSFVTLIDQYSTVAMTSDGSNANRAALLFNPLNRYGGYLSVGGVVQYDTETSAPTGSIVKQAMTFSAGYLMVNGVAIRSGPSVSVPAAPTILSFSNAPNPAQGAIYIRRVRYWPRALSAPELQGATL